MLEVKRRHEKGAAFDRQNGEGGSRRAAFNLCLRKGCFHNLDRNALLFDIRDWGNFKKKVKVGGEIMQMFERSLNRKRLLRYAPDGSTDLSLAIKRYVWNCHLAAEFQLPLRVAEVATRNSIQRALRVRFSNPWYDDALLLKLLAPRHLQDLQAVINDEKALHGTAFSDDHLVSSLTFGFWDHLTVKRYERTLWKAGIVRSFPGSVIENGDREQLNDLIQNVRRWRNRLAHHKSLIDKDPKRKYAETVKLIRWCNPDLAVWVENRCRVIAIADTDPNSISV